MTGIEKTTGTDGLHHRCSASKEDGSAPAKAEQRVRKTAASRWSTSKWFSAGRWKPFPWNWLPDSVAMAFGTCQLLFLAPLLSVLIVTAELTWYPIITAWRHPRMAWVRATLPGFIRSRISRPMAAIMLRDLRNHSYLPWITFLATFTPLMFLWAARRYMVHGLELSTLFIYHFLRIGPRFRLFAHIHTLVHKEGHAHRGLWNKQFSFFGDTCQWWIGPFYGVVPNNYSVAHNKIHHRWHNDVDDVHTNLDLDRTRFDSFLIYTPRFTLYWTGITPAALFVNRREWALLAKLLHGMVAYYGVTLLLWCWDPVFCICYWIFPHMESCTLLCAISYLWHAFVEESDPGNQYVNAVTILDGHDNIWNEDYHVVHHFFPNVHWSDAPAMFEENKAKYAECTATIFRETEEGMLLKWLFEQNWDKMAEHFVDLNGKMSHEEKKALLLRRLRVQVGACGRNGKRLQHGWASTETIRDWE